MNSIVLVTGASGGIGRALLPLLRMQNQRIAVVGRTAERLADLDADARIVADCTTHEGAEQALSACCAQLGAAPSGLVHCVGNTLIAPIHRTRPDAFRDIMRINLDSAFYIVRAWLGALHGAPGASVLLSSVVARLGVANHEAIAAAKGGIEALVRSTAATYAQQGIRCNAVAPGMTETPMTAGLLKLQAMREGAERQYPLGGIQTAQQVAATIAWLLSPAAERITGQVIAVDGGFTTIRPLVK